MTEWIEQQLIRGRLLEDLPNTKMDLQTRLNNQVALGAAAIVLAVTIFRPLLADLPPFFFFAGLVNSGLLFLLWWQLHRGFWHRQASFLVVALCTLVALPMLVVSGGANSQYSPIIPLFPIFCILMGSVGLAIVTTLFWGIIWTLLLLTGYSDLDLTASHWDHGKTASRTLWLILTSLIILLISISFENRQRRLQRVLVSLSVTDPLTGTGNRRVMEEALIHEARLYERYRQPYSLLMIDVDHFKRFNDKRGHRGGDQALIQVANTLTAIARDGQDTVARFGGEEFVAILRYTRANEAMAVAEKFRQAILNLKLRYQDDNEDVLSVTIGLADSELSNEPTRLIELADKALYKGKSLGRNCVIKAEHTINA